MMFPRAPLTLSRAALTPFAAASTLTIKPLALDPGAGLVEAPTVVPVRRGDKIVAVPPLMPLIDMIAPELMLNTPLSALV